MKNTRLMSRLFSATNEKDEELVNQVAGDIENAKANGSVDTDELKFEHVGDGKVAITDKENGEVTVAERAEDGNYDLYPAEPTAQLEGFIHPEGDGVTPGAQEGTPDEHVEEHVPTGVAESKEEKTVEETAAEGAPAEEVCPECGKNPCECEGKKEGEKEFSVTTNNSAVLRIFSDQAFCERLFSETLESGETTTIGNLKIEKDPEADNVVIVEDTNTGDSAKVTVDDEELTIDEVVEAKNFAEEAHVEENANGGEQFEGVHVVGVDVNNHEIVDATEYDQASAEELVARLKEDGVDAVEILDSPEAARDYAIDLLNNLGADENIEEPVQTEYSEHVIYRTKFYSAHTKLMDRLFSEACNGVDASQAKIEEAIAKDEVVETETEIITPVADDAVIVENKEDGECTKVTVEDDALNCEPISKEDAEEEKKFSHIYCDEAETKFFSDTEMFTAYMERLFSGDADEKKIEEAIENGDQIETDKEVITPVDAETAIIEDKENGEFTKAVMDDEKLDVTPISEEEADELTKDLVVEDKKEEGKPEEEPKKEEEPRVEKPEEKKEDEKEFSDSILSKFFAEVVGVAPAAAPVTAPAQAPVVAQAVPAEAVAVEPAPTVEAIEDKAVAAVQSIQAAAAEAEAAIMNAKAAPAEGQEQDLQEAQFSEKKFSDTNDTLVSWLNGNGYRK